MTETTTQRGAHNMLVNCANAQSGQRLLIAYEPERFGFFDAGVIEHIEAAAHQLGMSVSTIDVGFDAEHPVMTPQLHRHIQNADVIVFLARLGDQLRFSDMPPGKTIINSYTLNAQLLGSGFANAHHGAFVALKSAVDLVLANAKQVQITCPAGTHVQGRPYLHETPAGDTSLKRFPLTVFAPVPAAGFSGRVALAGFLTGTGSRYYADYTVEFSGPVMALLEDGMLAGFEGRKADVDLANAHYDRIAGMFGIDRNFVHSWHAGIHPGCGYPWDMRADYHRWGGAAFGNPRVLHFHTCGAYAPGEISWNTFDPTIIVDGCTLWENGEFKADRLAYGPDILAKFPCAAGLFAQPDRNIGLLESFLA